MIALLLASAGVVASPYGTTAAGERVERISLRNARGTTVSVLTLGGIIDEVRAADRRGVRTNVVLALPDLAGYEARANFGSLIGRYAGRISGGGFTLEGERVTLATDPKAIVSHGGTPGFGARVWAAEPCARPGCSAVTLRYVSPDGENGFPGTLSVTVTYTLQPDDTLRLDYAATTTRTTVINLTHHGYWNLAGAGSGSADSQYLRVPASATLDLDSRRVPTGTLRPVSGTPFDLRNPGRIGDRVGSADPQMRLARGIDHFFVLDRPGQAALAACAWDPVSGRMLEVRTSAPGVQIYTANSFDGTLLGSGGRTIRQGDGYAIETQAPPDAPNRPEFTSTVLRRGETWQMTTRFRLRTATSLAAFARRCR
jgi:aldose 1-epimerase